MTRAPQAVVIGDSAAAARTLRLAEAAGACLAELGFTVITGGRGGVMAAASRGAARVGGLTIGIVPSTSHGEGNRWCRVVLPSGLGHARNALTALAGDVVVAIGGGAGTLSELALASIHGRPIYVLGGAGGWSEALADRRLDRRARARLIRCADVPALARALRRRLRRRRGRRA
jgi:uncharacterized protein (TIGR00725 family)